MTQINCSLFNFQTGTCTQVNMGFDFSKTLTYTDPNNAAINITGFDFVMTVKDVLGGSTILTLPIVATNLLTGFYIPSPSTGVLFMQIAKADTAAITGGAGVYPYEIVVTDPDTKENVYFQGTIQFYERGF